MTETRIQFNTVVKNQLPSYVEEEYPLIGEFLKSYYQSQEFQGAPVDLIQNIDRYIKVDNNANSVKSTTLLNDIGLFDSTIFVDNTNGFPESYGLIRIDNEIITYTGKTDNSFTGCIRGFSGVTSYESETTPDQLVFSTSDAAEHTGGVSIENLSVLFLDQFFRKVKNQFLPGFEERSISTQVNRATFLKNARDFYRSRGTDESFKILFKSLYGENVSINRPKENLLSPSSNLYRITNDFVVEHISGDITAIENLTMFQDEYGQIKKSYAPVTRVEKVLPSPDADGNDYYRISIDAGYDRDVEFQGATYGTFSVHPTTKVIGNIQSGQTTINVDSTIGFENSGELYVTYFDGTTGVITYDSKSINQFFGCSGILDQINDGEYVSVNTFVYVDLPDTSERVLMRILSVMNDVNIITDNYYYNKDDIIELKTLGTNETGIEADNWVFNSRTNYRVSSISLLDSSNSSYRVSLTTNHIFRVGDSLEIVDQNNTKKTSKILSVIDEKTVVIFGQGQLSTTSFYTLHRNLLKVSAKNFNLSEVNSNVQNVYVDDGSILIASPSIPTYKDTQLQTSDQKIVFSGSFVGDEFRILQSGDHGFYSGDVIYYTPEKIISTSFDIDGNPVVTEFTRSSLFDEGIYFVSRVDSNTIKLAVSRSNLYSGNFVTLDTLTDVSNNTIQPYRLHNKSLRAQNLFREISLPQEYGTLTETESGKTGILVNGVEILNYKSTDKIYYGKVDKIVVGNSGSDYDIINPPSLQIEDSVGTGATGYVSVTGSLQEIRILDSGFDYLEMPYVNISGGNGSGAVAKANLKQIDHLVYFSSDLNSDRVSIGNSSSIGFSTYHKFRNAEKVFYYTDDQKGISGLSTGSVYNVGVIDNYTVKLYKNENDASLGINTITFTDYGLGSHYLKSYNKKSVVSSISILNPGSGYSNNKNIISGISTASDTFTIRSHGYSSGEIVKYTTDGSVIGGLTLGGQYFVTKIDDDVIKLSAIGTGEISREFYYRNSQFVDLISTGSGNHYLNYPEIQVDVIGKVGISSIGTDEFKCIIQPIFRGQISSVNLVNNGVGYGSSEILNHNREPNISLRNGNGAQLQAIVNDGKIVEVLVNKSGEFYFAPPEIQINSVSGSGAVLTPVIENGQIKDVKVIQSGSGFSSVQLSVIPAGTGALFTPILQTWRVNLFQKYFGFISDDDGFIDQSINPEYELQYVHLYAPRKLREILPPSDQSGKILFGKPDLITSSGVEVASRDHSPIIGWSYDGHPIYGPYGYSKKSGGTVTQMLSGYRLDLKENRPPKSSFPEGFFVEDYTYIPSVEENILDENNGRFCVTPEYPNGVYAYFASFNEIADSSGVFNGYKRPSFPYLIGENFKSLPIEFNYRRNSNQDSYDLNETNWVRNTKFYNLDKADTNYDYIFLPYQYKNQIVNIKASSPGKITNVGIITGGTNYAINDRLIIENSPSDTGFGADIRVSRLVGKDVNVISCATTSVSGIEFYPDSKISGAFIGYSEDPLPFINGDYVSVSGFNTTSKFLNGSYTIGVSTSLYSLNVGVGTSGVTGIITYFSVSGSLLPNFIRENDILEIEDEKLKVLNIDTKSSRLRVLRAFDGTVAAAHSATSILKSIPRNFVFNSGIKSSFDFKVNKELYFNPAESVGVGTLSGLGIGVTLNISNPGAGLTEIFVPSQQIYLPNHNLQTGDSVSYSTNGGSPLGVSTNGISTSVSIGDQSILYVAKIDTNFIGLSTVRVAINTLGSFAGIASTTSSQGLLYFISAGIGNNHSITTNYPKVLTGSISKNTVTVSTAQTHGLLDQDTVYINVNPGITTTVIVKYNDYNSRVVFDPRNILSSDINILTNEITINDHKLINGQKVIYTSSTPSGGLVDNKFYYVIVVDRNSIKLANTYYDAQLIVPVEVNITSATDGVISPINPTINVYKNSTVIFDVSDSSLSYIRNSTAYPAFNFIISTDNNFINEYNKSDLSKEFDISRTGIPGTSVDAKVTLTVNENTPSKLYYTLTKVNDSDLPLSKRNYVVDDETNFNNQIVVSESGYNGRYEIKSSSSSSFEYQIDYIPESLSYNSTDSIISYSTESLNVVGPIARLQIANGGVNYYNLPIIRGVNTGLGSGAIFEIDNNPTIGKILSYKFDDIGFNYPSDKTIRPTSKLPEILKVEKQSVFDTIGITSYGRGYSNIAPKLLVFDGLTGEQKQEVDLRMEYSTNQVTILQNVYGISDTTPKILPINNVNGVGISTISFNNSTKDVTIVLSQSFSLDSDFPVAVGDRFLVENINVGIASTNPSGDIVIVQSGKGYNSEKYDYRLFTVKSVDKNLGGVGIVTYNLDGYLKSGEVPGIFNQRNSSGRLVPEKDFPQFNIKLKKTEFYKNEKIVKVSDLDTNGKVLNWDPDNGLLKIQTKTEFNTGDLIQGLSSKTRAFISNETNFKSNIKLDSFARVENGWDDIVGFLNNSNTIIQNGDYYQNFAYSLRSKVQLKDWDDVVSSLNHTVGFLKFSDLQVESTVEEFNASVGLTTDRSDFEIITDCISSADVNCYYNFDLVSENNIQGQYSDQIIFNSKILTDYAESIGNRVLSIDDVSGQFNSFARPTAFSEVHRFPLSSGTAHKYITCVKDRRFTLEKQIMLVSLLHEYSGTGYINQYGRLSTLQDLGSFDFSIDGLDGVLYFYPTKSQINDYDVTVISYNLIDSVTGVGTSTFGVVDINTNSVEISGGSSGTIVSIGTSYNSAKILVQSKSIDGDYEYEELTIIKNGSDIDLLEYGQLTNTSSVFSTGGLGTYYPYISGSNLNVDFISNVGVAVSVNTIVVAMGDTTTTGIGSFALNLSELGSDYTSIASTASPSSTIISGYTADYSAGYFIIQISDLDNGYSEITEVLAIHDDNDVQFTQFASLETGGSLGSIGALKNGEEINITFTPIANTNIETRVFFNNIKKSNIGDDEVVVDWINSNLRNGYGVYTGTETDIKRQFYLTHENDPIFERVVDPSVSDNIGLAAEDPFPNAIRIPNHFFVTGEELIYSYPGAGTSQAIGIGTTSITGIGTTDKLPNSVFVVKVDDNKVRFSETAEKSLRRIPDTFEISHVGIGTSHKFIAKNQNSKVLVTIDNMIQSPLVSTALTTTLDREVTVNDDLIYFTGITSFFGGDLVKIDNEVMKIRSVGIGSTNGILVRRPWLGTGISTHGIGATIVKINGNYNIVDNYIHFVEAPYGNVPLTTTSAPPDQRDYLGISTSSTFHGRSFLRSGLTGSSNETYFKNKIYDDVSENFNGLTQQFTLKSDGNNVSGIRDENAIILINDIFQGPGSANDYILAETAGVTSVRFNEVPQELGYDVNVSNLPVGGVIVSVGSTNGFGYQPLVSAGGTAIVSIAGTVQSVAISTTGSGYRSQSKYDILSKTTTIVSSGSTEFFVNNENSIFDIVKLQNTGSNCNIAIGTYVGLTTVISTGSTSFFIGAGYTSSGEIPAGTSVKIEISDPVIGYANVSVANSSTGIPIVTHVGFATINAGSISTNVTVTNPGSGYTVSNLPYVIIDDPLSYSNIPLIYSENSTLGFGTQATVDIVVGQGSSVIDFEIRYTGYGYGIGEILTVPIGGLTGIPTSTSLPFTEFSLEIQKIASDKFAAWSIGELLSLDNIDGEFDGISDSFNLRLSGNIISIRSSKGSNISIQDTLLVFYNDILQVPGQGYIFNGGSTIKFAEPPKIGDTVKIVFYRGSGSIDVLDVDVLETVKEGDYLTINSDPLRGQGIRFQEEKRLVTTINSTDLVTTNAYPGPGIVSDTTILRPVTWCKQTEERFINGAVVGKDRVLNEALLNPTTNVIQTIGSATTIVFVESTRPFFNPLNENNILNDLVIIKSQDTKVSASATSTVSIAGTISQVDVTDGGFGYTSSPEIIIQNPVGLGTTQRAFATASITSGVVTSITVTNPGSGYTTDQSPYVLIEPPSVVYEENEINLYEGDFGIITGVSTISVGLASTGIVFDFIIPHDSFLRDSNVAAATTLSGIQTGYYFVINNSNVGNGVTTLDSTGSVVGSGNSFIDGVYQVAAVSYAQTSAVGYAVTDVVKVTVSISNYNGLSGLGFSGYYGDFSWGRISFGPRVTTNEYPAYTNNGYPGIQTGSTITRKIPLKYQNYL